MRPRRYILCCIALFGLSACSSGMEDLEQKVAEVKSRKSQQIEPVPQIKQFEAFAYLPGGTLFSRRSLSRMALRHLDRVLTSIGLGSRSRNSRSMRSACKA
jgi:hypothetical protein